MKKFIIHFFLMSTLIFISWGFITLLIFLWVEAPVNIYNAAAIDKKERLMSIDNPKIILAAGSNFAFGLDSKMIENETGLSVVNLGLHAGLGYKFTTEMAKDNLNPGDIIVIGLEYEFTNQSADTETIFLTLENDWTLASNLDFDIWGLSLMGLPEYTFNRAIQMLLGNHFYIGDIYSRTSFNEYGDVIAPRPKNIMNDLAYERNVTIKPDIITEEFVDYFKKYLKEIKSKNASVVFTFPAINERNINSESNIKDFVKVLNSIGIPIISNLNDYIMKDEYFYDSHYHLNDPGVTIRTKQLIQDMKDTILKP